MVSTAVKQVIVLSQLILIMLNTFGLTILPGSLQHDIQRNFNINASQYGLLFSVFNWAALIDIFHGYLLDRYLGIKLATYLYSTLVLIGSVMFCIAGFTKNFLLLLFGRTIIGFGVNPIVLCTNKHIIYWFSRSNYSNLVFSVNESTLWLGSSICYFVSVNLFKYIEHYRPIAESLAITLCLETSIMSFFVITPSLLLGYMYGCMEESQNDTEESWQQNTEVTKNLTWRDYLTLPLLFWIFSITMFIYFMSILSFLSMSQVFFKRIYHLTTTHASTLSGLITILAFILSPPFGYLLDRIGCNLIFLTGAVFLNIISHGIFAFTNWNPVIPVMIMAISIVLSSSLWSQFQYLVAEHQYMIAYGVAQTGLNGGLAVGTITSGVIIDKYGYSGFITSLFILIVCTIPILILMWIFNYKKGNILNLNPKNKLIYLGRNKDK